MQEHGEQLHRESALTWLGMLRRLKAAEDKDISMQVSKIKHLLVVSDPTGHYGRAASERDSRTGGLSRLHLQVFWRVFKT